MLAAVAFTAFPFKSNSLASEVVSELVKSFPIILPIKVSAGIPVVSIFCPILTVSRKKVSFEDSVYQTLSHYIPSTYVSSNYVIFQKIISILPRIIPISTSIIFYFA